MVDEVMSSKAANAFCDATAGHHAETVRRWALPVQRRRRGARISETAAERVAIVVSRRPSAAMAPGDLPVKLADVLLDHEMPLYPGTGARGEHGEHSTIATRRAGDAGEEFRAAFEATILPRLREFKPDLLLISAGFDAHLRDPLANLNLLETDYDWVTRKLMEIADASAGGRVVSLLEGGYDLQGLAGSVAAHVTALMRG
jgi:acetoin utilization deacetylase AcuC-like enzyme